MVRSRKEDENASSGERTGQEATQNENTPSGGYQSKIAALKRNQNKAIEWFRL